MRGKQFPIYLEDDVWFGAVFLLLFVSAPWLCAAGTAAVFHELGHILVLLTGKKKVTCIRIGITGARICSAPLTPGEAILSIAAGPAVSLSLAAALRIFPRLAICGIFQGLFNLLPIPGLDGWNLLRAMRELVRKIPCKQGEERVQ